MKRMLSILLAAVILSAALAVSGCNQTESGQDQSETSVSSESSTKKKKVEESSAPPIAVSSPDSVPKLTSAQITSINESLTAYQSIPSFNYSAKKISATEIAEEKSIALVTKNSTNSFFSLLEGTFKNAAKSAGYKKVTVAETDGNVSSINDGMNLAVEEKSDLLLLEGDINKQSVSNYIENTQANGIEVYSSGSRGLQEKDVFVDDTVPINYEKIGALMADWGIVKTNGKLNALAVSSATSPLSDTIFKGFKAEFEKYVSSSDGYCTTLSVSSIDIGTSLTSKIKKAVQDDSNINYIFVFDEAAINDAIKAAAQLPNVKVVSTGGSQEALDCAQSGDLDMLVAQSYEWTAYALVDYSLRQLAGEEIPAELYVPVRIVNKDSIDKAIKEYDGSFEGFYEICFGGAFVDGYTEMWQL